MKKTPHGRRLLAGIAASTLLFASQAFSQQVVKLGYTGPLSGGGALFGKNVLDGMRMAADEINAEGWQIGGKPSKLEIVSLDDKYNPAESAINAQRLVQAEKTPVILVGHSGGTFALQTANEKQKYLLLSYSSVPQITANGNTLTWRIPPDFTTYIQPFTHYAMGKYGKKLGIAVGDHDYAKAWSAAFRPTWEAAGGTVVADNPMSYNRAADFYSGVSRVLAAKPDVLLVGGASEPTALVIKQARELGFKGGFVIIDQAKLDEIAKVTGGYGLLEGSIGLLPVVDDSSNAMKAFVERYRKLYPGRDPSSEVTLGYTGVRATAEAMKAASSATDALAIRAQLNTAMKALSAAANPHALSGVDVRGNSIGAVPVALVEGGKVREVKLMDLR
ncbi:branched-chain amino acid transport system substrate-binding protein [Variovorax paradoxus]|uniref:Branched-chain amino acid transport system substrate-binding protein n=1 Tax=Variovorax paradoxus TaxID=34073 RepID=A0AAW8EEX6_VARPD|nr:ABC transporter substrate-binding protein [Variovorax paradoxus]MDP9971716.1 branched-chain amino acid transport system substrate-binding protein [Variovorax paradoxus]